MDKTITYAPTWTSFLVRTARWNAPWRLMLLPVAGLVTLGYAAGLIGRARLKEITHRLLLGSALPEAVATAAAERFADRVAAAGVYAGARAQIAADRAAGCTLVLATASYGFYAGAIAALGRSVHAAGHAGDGTRVLGLLYCRGLDAGAGDHAGARAPYGLGQRCHGGAMSAEQHRFKQARFSARGSAAALAASVRGL